MQLNITPKNNIHKERQRKLKNKNENKIETLENYLALALECTEGDVIVPMSRDDVTLIIRALTFLKPLTDEKAAVKNEAGNPFASTVDDMLSKDYKKRFVAEYNQTKIRYERLKAFNNRIEASMMKNVEEPKHDCPAHLLRDQQHAMGEYLHILEVRAVIEGIEL